MSPNSVTSWTTNSSPVKQSNVAYGEGSVVSDVVSPELLELYAAFAIATAGLLLGAYALLYVLNEAVKRLVAIIKLSRNTNYERHPH